MNGKGRNENEYKITLHSWKQGGKSINAWHSMERSTRDWWLGPNVECGSRGSQQREMLVCDGAMTI